MKASPHPDNSKRLEVLREYDILDTPDEPEFDSLTKLAAEICGTPISVVNFVDEGRQWFKSEVGLGVKQTDLDISICAHAILEEGLMEVPDTLVDERFSDNPLVCGDPHLRFYAGYLLQSEDKLPLGTLCVLDYEPRTLTASQKHLLQVLGDHVMSLLELRRRARNEKRIQEQIARELALRKEIMAVVTHDLRSPLSNIMMGADLLKVPHGISDDDREQCLEVLGSSARDMDRIIEDLVDIDCIEQGRLSVRLDEMSLDGILEEAVARYEMIAERREISLLIVNSPREGDSVTADKKRVMQALGNVIGNAIKFSPRGGTVELALYLDEEFVSFSVKDSGPGISLSDQELIFERYYQINRAQFGGQGLGLSIADGIVRAHGGEMRLESAEGRGSTFILQIPLKR